MDDEDLSPKEISLRLDSLLNQYMSHLDKSLLLRENLSQVLKNGQFNISKARYTMGPLAVSQYKYPGVIHPSSLIKVDSATPDSCYSINTVLNTETNTITTTPSRRMRSNSLNNTNNLYATYEKDKKDKRDNEENNNNSSIKENGNAPILMGDTSRESPVGGSSLRRRKTDTSKEGMNTTGSYSGSSNLNRKKKEKDDDRSSYWSTDDLSIPTQTKTESRASIEKEKIERTLAAMKIGAITNKKGGGESSDEEEEEIKYKNPINWFGLLVPQNLRQAQSEFSKAMELIVELANIVHQMEVFQREYFTLLAKKDAQ